MRTVLRRRRPQESDCTEEWEGKSSRNDEDDDSDDCSITGVGNTQTVLVPCRVAPPAPAASHGARVREQACDKARQSEGNETAQAAPHTSSAPARTSDLADDEEELDDGEGFVAMRIACGARHTLASTRLGRLFAWGCGSFGQHGTGSRDNELVPRAVILGAQDRAHVGDTLLVRPHWWRRAAVPDLEQIVRVGEAMSAAKPRAAPGHAPSFFDVVQSELEMLKLSAQVCVDAGTLRCVRSGGASGGAAGDREAYTCDDDSRCCHEGGEEDGA